MDSFGCFWLGLGFAVGCFWLGEGLEAFGKQLVDAVRQWHWRG